LRAGLLTAESSSPSSISKTYNYEVSTVDLTVRVMHVNVHKWLFQNLNDYLLPQFLDDRNRYGPYFIWLPIAAKLGSIWWASSFCRMGKLLKGKINTHKIGCLLSSWIFSEFGCLCFLWGFSTSIFLPSVYFNIIKWNRTTN
jgi:hypothetical protein